MKSTLLNGIICAMVTPFDDQQKINLEATKNLIEQLLQNKINGIFILGTNGEFHVMSNEEKLSFADFVVQTVKHKVPVFVGTGSNSTQETIELSQKMEKIGVDALSIITPFLVPITQNELVEHYKRIAASVSIPVILYNIPKNTGISIAVESVTKLAQVKNIIGIKDSSGNIDNIINYIQATKEYDFSVLSGSDSLILKALKAGATGAIASTSNLLSKIDVGIYNDFCIGNMEEAEKKQQSIEKLRAVLKLGTVPSVIKRAVSLAGINVGPARYPVADISENIDKEIVKMLDSYGIKHVG